MATWLWPIAPALHTGHEISRPTPGHVCLPQEQRQQGPSAYPDMGAQQEFHTLWVKDGKGEQQPAKLQETQCMDTRQDPTLLILAWAVPEVCLPWMRGDPQSSHPVVGLHPLRDWGWPETSRKLSKAEGCLRRPCWERTPVPVHRHAPRQAPVPAEERAARAFSAPSLSAVCFFKALY